MKEVIRDEMDSIMFNNIWILICFFRGCKFINSKWIFKKNLKVDIIIDKYKVIFVVRGFD